MKTRFHVLVSKYMIYSMTINETCTIRQISLGAMKKIVYFVRTGVLKSQQSPRITPPLTLPYIVHTTDYKAGH